MTAEYIEDDRFRGARVRRCDLAGLEIRDCDLSGIKIVDSWANVLRVDGYFDHLVVNDVDVSAYVDAELDRRHPVRALARVATSPDEFRGAWDEIETLWAATLDRARSLPEAKLHERVGGEWSLVDAQRHLLFASDAWLGSAVLEEQTPYHPLGLPAEPGFPAADTAKLGLTPDAAPTLDEVLAPRLARMAVMRRTVEALTDSELDRICSRKPADPYPDQEYVVGRCLKVVLKEEAEHHRYTVRDLALLETTTPGE
ncbi:DinB family protein [Acidiferrimicrobium sp. IK]|uniref:DinB family protein n=1 Tax=Acidiferrimicrobium sp. IK TaxID=2871700 RepID=UPI0021CAF4BE|nr:DinB family protein [Acidiferrimicrobium sp. IK]MCU4183054.1 DinB family protein [Acidiferrimicrobium sp. IK]